jgi:hypothetical protein
MGIGAGLLGLASSVRFEDLHVLTREEIARFGLDRREFVEAPWKFESNGLRRMHKIAGSRRDILPDATIAHRLLRREPVCGRISKASVAERKLRVGVNGRSRCQAALLHPSAAKSIWLRALGLGDGTARAATLLDRPQAELTEIMDGAFRKPSKSPDGWAGALENLLASCPPAKHPAIPTARRGKLLRNKMVARSRGFVLFQGKILLVWAIGPQRTYYLARRPFTTQPLSLHAPA